MSRTGLEVADVFRAAGAKFLQTHRGFVSSEQLRVASDLVACRTAALGGHVDGCNACGHRQISYNSCRNRHGPKCQGAARANWLKARSSELLPVPRSLADLRRDHRHLWHGLDPGTNALEPVQAECKLLVRTLNTKPGFPVMKLLIVGGVNVRFRGAGERMCSLLI